MRKIHIEYVAKKLKFIVKVAKEYEIDAQSEVDGYDYLIKDVEDFLKEITQ